MEILSKENFEEKVKSQKIVVVDFYADWCMPCKTMMPLMEEINNESEDRFVIYKVNVDSDGCKDIAASFGVRSIPTLIFFKDGVVSTKKVGMINKKDFLDIIDSL